MILLCTAILAITVIVPAYRTYNLSRQNLYEIQNYRLILDAATYLSAERGPANNVMSEGPETGSAERLAQIRARTDATLAELAAQPEVPFGIRHDPIPAALLEHVRDQLALARAKVDHVAALAPSPSKLGGVEDAIESMFLAWDRFHAIIEWRSNELVREDAHLAAPALMGQMLGDLREYGGRIASQIMAPIATGQPLPVHNVIESRQSQGRLLQLWQLIEGQSPLYDTQSLAENRAAIEDRFFGEGLSLVNDLIDAYGRGEGYTLSATELTDRFVPTMQPIEAYRSAFLDAAVDNFVKARASALAALATAIVATSTILILLIGLVLSIRTQIFRPLLRAHEEVLRLADDRPGISRYSPGGADELRNLFQAIEVLQDKLEERASLTSELRAQAETDGLTGLFNRRTLEGIAQSQPSTGSTDQAVCLILLDIDHFKAINDTYGHPTGDRVLIQAAGLLRSLLRSGDVVARFGGEEFAILIPGNDVSAAAAIAEKTRLAIQRETFTTSEGAPFKVTASFGVAGGHRGERTWPQLFQQADEALYRAKSEGRNRVGAAPPGGSDLSTPPENPPLTRAPRP